MRRPLKEKIIEFLIVAFIIIIGITMCLQFMKSFRKTKINSVDIIATIQTNGDVYITENYEYKFIGEFNGIYRDFDIENYRGVVIEEVITIIDENGETKEYVNSPESKEGTYFLDNKGTLKVYTKSKNESKKATLKYTIKNAAYKKQDKSVFCFNFYTLIKGDSIKNGSVAVSLENNLNGNKMLDGYFDGKGTVNKTIDGNLIKFDFEKLKSDLNVRIDFDKDFLDDESSHYYDNIKNDDGIYINDEYSSGGIVLDGWTFVIILTVCVILGHLENIYLILTGRVDEVEISTGRNMRRKSRGSRRRSSSSGGSRGRSSSGGF